MQKSLVRYQIRTFRTLFLGIFSGLGLWEILFYVGTASGHSLPCHDPFRKMSRYTRDPGIHSSLEYRPNPPHYSAFPLPFFLPSADSENAFARSTHGVRIKSEQSKQSIALRNISSRNFHQQKRHAVARHNTGVCCHEIGDDGHFHSENGRVYSIRSASFPA